MQSVLTFLLPLLTIGLIIWFFTHNRQFRKPKAAKTDHHTRQERGVWAWGTVLESSAGEVNMVGQKRVQLSLDVHLPGTPHYTAKTTWLVDQDALGYVEMGKEVSLKVDPQEPTYIYPNGTWAKFAE